MATKVTAAHHSIWRHLYDAKKIQSKLKFVTLDKERNTEHAVVTRRVSYKSGGTFIIKCEEATK